MKGLASVVSLNNWPAGVSEKRQYLSTLVGREI